MVEARRPNIILVDKQAKVAKIIKIAIPGDARVKDKELEKIEKYQFLPVTCLFMFVVRVYVIFPPLRTTVLRDRTV